MATELIDELEAGELAVEFEGEEPEALLEWAFERFAPRIALSTAFQIDGVCLLDMAYRLDPEVKVFSVDTGRLPEETFDLIESLRDRYPGLELSLLAPEAAHVQGMVGAHGPNLFRAEVSHRLLCCQVRKVLPLQKHLATLDAWVTGSRRSVPAAAGIPITHRGVAAQVTVLAGHQPGALDYHSLAQARGTLVVFMGLAGIDAIASRLMAAGKDPETPAAVIASGSLDEQKVVIAPIERIVAASAAVEPPALIVIGNVVGLREKIAVANRRSWAVG